MAKVKILVIDDEENIRVSIHGILSDEGYEVNMAKDGETAVRMARAHSPDIILLDIWMPGIDGIQTLKLLRGMGLKSEVIMMSGHGAIDTAVKATKLGAFDFIEKPFSLETILKTISSALEGAKHRIPVLSGKAEHYQSENWFCGPSRISRRILKDLDDAAKANKPVLLISEPGLTSEMAARYIAGNSGKSKNLFMHVSGLISSGEDGLLECFGLETKNKKYAKTQPMLSKVAGGTLFVDRIDALSARTRRKILEVLSVQAKTEDLLIIVSAKISSSKRSSKVFKAISDKLQPNTVLIEPLFKRREDMLELSQQFVESISKQYGKNIKIIESNLLDRLTSSSAIRYTDELRHVLELATLGSDGDTLTGEHVIIAGQEESIKESEQKKESKKKKLSSRMVGTKSPKSIPQCTLKSSVVLCGQGLHSGLNTGLILSPLPPDSGILFWSISTGTKIPASLESVKSTEYATTLSSEIVTIKTVEHILSALHSYGITNLLIKIGDEAPIMDGSAREFCELIENGELVEQEANIEPIVIKEEMTVSATDGTSTLTVEPADGFTIDYFLDYPQPVGKQRYQYEYRGGSHYKDTVAPARTFGFLKDIKMLEKMGLASGGKLSNFILIDSEKVINTPLRFPNEPARHKVLDLIGDLYLLGRPICGKFTARQSGHTQNIEMVRKINETLVKS